MRFENKTAVVTGGSRGIGLAIATKLAKEGANIAILYVGDENEGIKAKEELSQYGTKVEQYFCDVSNFEESKKVVDQVIEEFGSIEILVNNAGTADIELFTDMTDEKLCEMMNVNLLGAMRMSRAVLPEMIREHSGNVINITSVWGEKGASCEVAYSAAKAGLIGFTKALAREVAISGIRVNCVSCGMIDTKMNGELTEEDVRVIVDDIPAGRIGKPRDVANVVRFLSGEGADYIHGQVVRVDGCWI